MQPDQTKLYIGQMSGTSLDGIDTVLLSISENQFNLVSSSHVDFPESLKSSILSLCNGTEDELHLCEIVSNELSQIYAKAANDLLKTNNLTSNDIHAIGCHGQTVRHMPPKYTVQLINGALLAELTNIDVVCDFRSRDMAAGGQGAPLVPAFHKALFHANHTLQDMFIVNIGGMSNITFLGKDGSICGHDTGPGNVLMDTWIQSHKNSAYDNEGKWASSGTIDNHLLKNMLDDPYFVMAAPKSTGREHFNSEWLSRLLHPESPPENIQASLLQLTVESIARELEKLSSQADVIICGGGAYNLALLDRLKTRLEKFTINTSREKGIDPQWIEAMAFAWLASQTLERLPGNVPKVTGANGLKVLGAIYPA